jgi:hypothetical protein
MRAAPTTPSLQLQCAVQVNATEGGADLLFPGVLG